jgi:hypothetical protein
MTASLMTVRFCSSPPHYSNQDQKPLVDFDAQPSTLTPPSRLEFRNGADALCAWGAFHIDMTTPSCWPIVTVAEAEPVWLELKHCHA